MSEFLVKLNGIRTEAETFVWAGPLTAAWHELNKIIKDEVKVVTDDPHILQLANNFNKCIFSIKQIPKDCYYMNVGFGNKGANMINKQIIQKFPGKTTPPFEPIIEDNAILLFGYFLKQLKFEYQFNKKEVTFKNQKIKGFEAKTMAQKNQISVHSYKNPQSFLVSLKTLSLKDEVFLLKVEDLTSPEQVVQHINKVKGRGDDLSEEDHFQMPTLSIKVKRHLDELKGICLENKSFSDCYFADSYEIINFEINEEGARKESEAQIKKEKKQKEEQKKIIKLDRQFWLIIREPLQHPYFMMFVNEVKDEMKVRTYVKKEESQCSIF